MREEDTAKPPGLKPVVLERRWTQEIDRENSESTPVEGGEIP
jgi:hypothetical protein